MFALRTAISAAALAVESFSIAGLAFISAGGYGECFCRNLWHENRTPLEETIFSAALGYGLISFLIILAGLFSFWTRAGAWIILAGGLTLSRPFLNNLRHGITASALQVNGPEVLIALCALWAFLLALAPVTYYDSLVYHFAMPAAYVQAHHWLPLKALIYSAFPQNLEMLWTFGLLLANQTVANLISLTLAILAAAAVYSFARRYFTGETGRMAVMLLAAMPAFLLLSSGGYVDVGLTLYAFLSFYALCVGMDTKQPSVLFFSGLLAGLTMGIKYTGGIPLAISGALLLWNDRSRPSHALRYFALYTAATLLAVSPWLIKNIVYVGNPVFPFFYAWGNPKLSPWVQSAAGGYFRGVAEYRPRSGMELLRLPWDIIVNSLRFGGGMDVLGDYGWAPLIVLTLALPLCRKQPSITRRLVAYSLLFVLPWALTRPVLRFLLPLAPVLALLAGAVWTEGMNRFTPLRRWAGRGILAALFLMGFAEFFNITGVIGQFPVALGLIDRDVYLSRKLNYYPAARFVNSLPEARRVFVLGDQRGYYYNKPVMVSPVFNENPFVTWADQADSPKALAALIKAQGITHIIVNFSEMRRLANYHVFDFSEKGRRNWQGLESGIAHPVYRDQACEVLQL